LVLNARPKTIDRSFRPAYPDCEFGRTWRRSECAHPHPETRAARTVLALSSAPGEPGTESTTIKLLTILFRARKRAHLRQRSQLLSGGILKDVENGSATLPHTGSQSPAS